MVLQTLKRLIPHNSPIRLAWHKTKALAAAVRYGFPAKKLTVIGITGTDGKTTTVGMVAHILNANGIKVGALSTAFFRINDRVEWNATQKTSPSPFIIQKFLRDLVDAGCTHAVLEYSSHGLVQGRMNYTYPSIAGITNMSEEHLDYHGSMDEYIRAKGLLFEMLKEHGTKVENYDDISFEYLRNIRVDADAVVYSPKSQFKQITPHPSSVSGTLRLNAIDYNLTLPIPGAFNLHNALCALCCALAIPGMKNKDAQAVESLKTFTGIPGRMEHIDAGQDFHVFVDFTVTPQSYEATLSTLKAALPSGKRLLVLTGSCGDRMKEKRPIVGKIVSRYADVMVVANEDPYTEDPEKIIDEVWAGVDQSATKAHLIFDRRKAIYFLLSEAKSGDIVILCGKGSDTTMWLKDGQIPWNEREIVREILRA
jgi:UDP-N-acetylmuramoyl-L-alanyl-D-glutamate--2,6-diaminopimelate ligase